MTAHRRTRDVGARGTPRPYLARPITILAHRGGAALAPENTLAAFERAAALGHTHIETDAHLTRDGEVVLCHDATVDRTTDGRGAVRSHTLAELKRLDAGHRFSPDGQSHPFRARGVTIPTFDEAIALSPVLHWNIDLKSHDASLARALFARVEALGVHSRVLVASEHGPTLRAFRRLARGTVATSAAFDEVAVFFAASRWHGEGLVPIAYDALQVPARHGRLTVVDRRLVDAAHGRGLHVHVWTIDAPAEMQRLFSLGVDGIVTDRPDRVEPDGNLRATK